ncbi:MAG: ornithine cyclodeaminase family protein [Acidobacteria bacterium]|nr:ornithine cyclodeaminase family protein [Acidobacteriota bacterium]
MIHVSEEQVRECLPMPRAIELIEEAFRRLDDGRAVNHPRRRVMLDNGAWLHYMAAGDNEGGYLASKVYVTRPRVGARFAVLLFDATTTELLATIDANALGQIRTGAATGVATRYMARKDACRLGMIGSGFQAEAQLEAVAAVRELRRVLVHSRSAERRESFARKMSKRLGLAVEAVDSSAAAVSGSDIVVTVTTAREPLFAADQIAQGCHINAAGSNHAQRVEIGADTVARAALIATDSVEQARMEAGDLIMAHDKGSLDWARVVELGAIVAGKIPGRVSDADVTLFESQGLAIEDLVAAVHVYKTLIA